MSSAWPVPSATTRTLMPVSFSKTRQQVPEQARLLGRRRRRDHDELLLRRCRGSAERERAARGKSGTAVRVASHGVLLRGRPPPRTCAAIAKKARGRRLLDEPAPLQEHDLVGQAPRLAEVVRRHHDRRAAGVDAADDLLDGARRASGRGSPSARRGTAPPAAAPRRAPARGAAARRPTARAPAASASARKPDVGERVVDARVAPRRPRRRRGRAHSGCWRRPSGAAAPAAGTPWPARAAASRLPPHAIVPPVGASETVEHAQQHALAGAVGAEHRRCACRARASRSTPSQRSRVPPRATPTSVADDRQPVDGRASAIARAPPTRARTCATALTTSTIAISTMPSAERERQVALARLERDRRRHHARDAVDVAADDHHRADLGDRAAEAGEQHRDQRKPRVPEQRRGRGATACAPSERSCSRYSRHASSTTCRDSAAMIGAIEDRLRDDHRRRREQQAERAERPGARQQQVDDAGRRPPAAGPSAR